MSWKMQYGLPLEKTWKANIFVRNIFTDRKEVSLEMPILKNLEVQKLLFWQFCALWISVFGNFVKATHLLNELLKSWLDGKKCLWE